MREELKAWSWFLDKFRGISFWREDRMLRVVFQVHLDAVGPLGFGIHFGDRLCAIKWTEEGHHAGVTRDLTILEFFLTAGASCLRAHKGPILW